MIPYVNVGVFVVVLVLAGFLATISRLSVFLLRGLHAYVLPDDSEKALSGDGEAERGPRGRERENVEKGHLVKKKKGSWPGASKRKKDKDVFDEGGAQMYRIRLADGQLESRKYFQEYDEAAIYSTLGLTGLLTREILQAIATSSVAKRRNWTDSLTPDDRITFVVAIFAIYKLLRLLAAVSYDPQLARKSERVLNWVAGILGFLVAVAVLMMVPNSVMDFGIDAAMGDARTSMTSFLQKKKIQVSGEIIISTTAVKFVLAAGAGVCSRLLFGPAQRNAKSFWVATDQLEWNVSVLKRRWVVRPLLNLAVVLPLLVALLWLKPMGELFIRSPNCTDALRPRHPGYLLKHGNMEGAAASQGSYENSGSQHAPEDLIIYNGGAGSKERRRFGQGVSEARKSQGFGASDDGEGFSVVEEEEGDEVGGLGMIFMSRHYDWACEFGVSERTFSLIQLWSLFFTGLLQMFLLRVNIQTFCDGAVLVWYENLDRSKVHNKEVVRAKIFLNNYFVCRIAVQSLIPAVLVLLTIGLSRTRGGHLDKLVGEGTFFFAPPFVRAVAYFGSWWLVFMPAVQTWVVLALFRVGLLTNTAA